MGQQPMGQPMTQQKLEQAFPEIPQNQNNNIANINTNPNANNTSSSNSRANSSLGYVSEKGSSNHAQFNNTQKRVKTPQNPSHQQQQQQQQYPNHQSNFNDNESEASSSPIKRYMSVDQETVAVVAQVRQEARREIVALQKQTQELMQLLRDRDAQLEEQEHILKDLESKVAEIQGMSGEEGGQGSNDNNNVNNLNTNNLDNDPNTSAIIQQLKRQHQEELNMLVEEKDRKIQTLKFKFDEKRAEFRTTIDALQFELHESSGLYIDEIKMLRAKMVEAEGLAARVEELETLVLDLDLDLKQQENSLKTEKEKSVNDCPGGSGSNEFDHFETKAQLQRLAEAENKLLEKDNRIKDLERQLSQQKDKPTTTANSNSGENSSSSFISPALKSQIEELQKENESLKNDLKLQQKRKEQAENELESMEGMLEEKIFRESELEKEIAELYQKLESSKSTGNSWGMQTGRGGSYSSHGSHSTHSSISANPNEFIATGAAASASGSTSAATTASASGAGVSTATAISDHVLTTASPVSSSLGSHTTTVSGTGLGHSRASSHHKRFSSSSSGMGGQSPGGSVNSVGSGKDVSRVRSSSGSASLGGIGSGVGELETCNAAGKGGLLEELPIGSPARLQKANQNSSATNTDSTKSKNPKTLEGAANKQSDKNSYPTDELDDDDYLFNENDEDYGLANNDSDDEILNPTLTNNKSNSKTVGKNDPVVAATSMDSTVSVASTVSIASKNPSTSTNNPKNTTTISKKDSPDTISKNTKKSDIYKDIDDANIDPTPTKPIDLAGGRKKWCGLCERDGHDSLECPFENEDDDLDF